MDYKLFKVEFEHNFLNDLQIEWNNQDKKFPNQKHTIENWNVILMEEIGELAKATLDFHKDYNHTNFHEELIQIITLAIRIRYTPYRINFKDDTIII